MTVKMEQQKAGPCAHSQFVQCMSSPAGRVVRVVGGVMAITGGLRIVRGRPGSVIAAMGIVSLVSGVLDRCGFSALSRALCAQDH